MLKSHSPNPKKVNIDPKEVEERPSIVEMSDEKTKIGFIKLMPNHHGMNKFGAGTLSKQSSENTKKVI